MLKKRGPFNSYFNLPVELDNYVHMYLCSLLPGKDTQETMSVVVAALNSVWLYKGHFPFVLNACIQTWHCYGGRLSVPSSNKAGEDKANIDIVRVLSN